MAVLSISRQFGAGGRTLAEKVSLRLGYDFVDDELVLHVAKAAGVPDERIRGMERKPDRDLKRVVAGLFSSRVIDGLVGNAVSGMSVPELFHQAILETADRGDVVILGRGSQFVLPNEAHILKVLLISPERDRIDFMRVIHGMPESEAQRAVREWERSRKAFLRKFSAKDPNDPSLYDLVINTGRVGMGEAVELVSELVGSRIHPSGVVG